MNWDDDFSSAVHFTARHMLLSEYPEHARWHLEIFPCLCAPPLRSPSSCVLAGPSAALPACTRTRPSPVSSRVQVSPYAHLTRHASILDFHASLPSPFSTWYLESRSLRALARRPSAFGVKSQLLREPSLRKGPWMLWELRGEQSALALGTPEGLNREI